jgi:ketosteroid isomerase-like protein
MGLTAHSTPERSMFITSGPIATPVTGQDAIGNLAEPLQALGQFYKALNARDMSMMEQNWVASPDAAMDNPLGGLTRGWPNIRGLYERLFTVKGSYRFEFWDYTLHRTHEMFFVVGRERGRIEIDGDALDLAIRTTRLFTREGSGWRQLHHHGSIDDAEMLSHYQRLVLGR